MSFVTDIFTSIFRGPSLPPPPPPPVFPETDSLQIKQREAEAKSAARRRRGRRATILTSGLGVTDPVASTKKSLLGE